jgi:hypothetical protein
MSSWTERDIILSIADGTLHGVTEYGGTWFAALKLSPVGVRWNPDGPYFEYRDKAVWLSPDMMARVIGLPLLAGMPDGEIDSAEFTRRIVGMVAHAFAADDALMSVCRICNDSALRAIQSGKFETRLTATFDSDDAAGIDINEGRLICEPKPRYISHISLVPEGAFEFEFGLTLTNKDVAYAY